MLSNVFCYIPIVIAIVIYLAGDWILSAMQSKIHTLTGYWIPKMVYRRTDYYKQTHTDFHLVLHDRGVEGEYALWKVLHKLEGYKKFLFNCYIPSENGETVETDMILLHESGIYVFESKNYSGWIFGSEADVKWTQTLKQRNQKRHNSFFNPILQNEAHCKWLGKYLGRESETFYSYIVFGDRCKLKDIHLPGSQHRVVQIDQLHSRIKKDINHGGKVMDEAEINTLYLRLLPLTMLSNEQKMKHIEDVRRKAGNSYRKIY